MGADSSVRADDEILERCLGVNWKESGGSSIKNGGK